MRKTTTTKKTDSDEIVFRVSFDNIDDSDDFIVTKDGKYHFIRTKSLKDDKTKYEVIYPDYRYHLVRINQEYYKQAIEAKKSILEKGEKDWPIYDFGRVAGRQIELYKKTLWLLSHNNLDGWEKSFNKLDADLESRISRFRECCDMLYGDDSLREYDNHYDEAKTLLNGMKGLVISSYSGKASAKEFEQIFNKERKRILLVCLPQKDQNMAMYIDVGGYVRRVECTGEQTKLAAKITQKLEKDKKFAHHKNYWERVNGEKIVNALFGYAYALTEGRNGYKRNRKLAYKIYTYLAERWNQADAYYNLGVFTQYGYASLKKDIKTAIGYYERAAEEGSLGRYAECNLGNIYMKGEGVAKDEKKALKYYRKAHSHGDAYATASLAKIYEKGKIVERDRLFAWKLYDEARKLANESDDDEDMWKFKKELEKDIEKLEKKLK